MRVRAALAEPVKRRRRQRPAAPMTPQQMACAIGICRKGDEHADGCDAWSSAEKIARRLRQTLRQARKR